MSLSLGWGTSCTVYGRRSAGASDEADDDTSESLGLGGLATTRGPVLGREGMVCECLVNGLFFPPVDGAEARSVYDSRMSSGIQEKHSRRRESCPL